MEYLLSIPGDFRSGRAYPALIALPPGDQSRNLALVYEPWLPVFQDKGWVVVVPIAPDRKLYFQGSERYLPQIMNQVESEIDIAGGRFYLFGVSNGGISAFRVATLNHDRFQSITVLPGWPKPADEKRLANILKLPVNFLVGEEDSRWLAKSVTFHSKIEEMGGDAALEIIQGEGHMAFASYPLNRLIEAILRNTGLTARL